MSNPRLQATARELLNSFQREPIEDGHSHPGEKIIEQALEELEQIFINWLTTVYEQSDPTISASILCCVGRLPKIKIKSWGLEMAKSGIIHNDVEVREAAVQALEEWGGHDSIEVLRSRQLDEQIPWLKKYINQVIVDLLSKTQGTLSQKEL